MKFRAVTVVTLVLFTGLIGVYSTPAMAELIPPPTEEPQPPPGDWMPYVPNSALVDLVSTADQWVSVNVTLWLTGCVVSDWGTLEQDGNDFWVDTQIWQCMGLVIQVVIPESHIYDLGYLEAGNYTFTFKAWGIDVKSVSFTVPTTATESIPTTEILYDWWSGYSFPIPEIYVIATETNPVEMLQNYTNRSAYYKMLKEHVTTEASVEDFISILVSRGICSTCGYGLEIKSIEKVDYAFVLSANFTDPGWECYVCQALTNPTALIPIGKLPAGEYSITLHIDRYIHHCDGRPREYVGTGTWTAAFNAQSVKADKEESPLLLETDKDVYVLGELIEINLTNIGSVYVELAGWPCVWIYDAEGEVVWPSVCTWCLWGLAPGESEIWIWDQFIVSAQKYAEPGTYVVEFVSNIVINGSIIGPKPGPVYFQILPLDISGPDITNLIQDPKGNESDPVPPYTNVKVSVNVSDSSGVQNVTLYYKTSTDAGETWSEWSDIEMNNTQGNTWRGEIPGFSDCTWVKYKIVAYDEINNEAIMDNAGEYFIYQVVPEFPTWTSILLILIVLTVAIAIYKRRQVKIPIH